MSKISKQNSTGTAVSSNADQEQLKKIAGVAFMLAFAAVLLMFPEPANAAGLSKVSGGLTKFLAEIRPIIKTVAIISVIGAGVGYMMNMVDKSLFFKIIGGILVIVGSTEIVNFFWN